MEDTLGTEPMATDSAPVEASEPTGMEEFESGDVADVKVESGGIPDDLEALFADEEIDENEGEPEEDLTKPPPELGPKANERFQQLANSNKELTGKLDSLSQHVQQFEQERAQFQQWAQQVQGQYGQVYNELVAAKAELDAIRKYGGAAVENKPQDPVADFERGLLEKARQEVLKDPELQELRQWKQQEMQARQQQQEQQRIRETTKQINAEVDNAATQFLKSQNWSDADIQKAAPKFGTYMLKYMSVTKADSANAAKAVWGDIKDMARSMIQAHRSKAPTVANSSKVTAVKRAGKPGVQGRGLPSRESLAKSGNGDVDYLDYLIQQDMGPSH